MAEKFDLLIIGGGAGGLFAASVANNQGAKTCIIDKEKLGGDCTWFGCMPSKSLLKSAQVAEQLKRAAEFGLKIKGNFDLDASEVMSHVQDVVHEISLHHEPEIFENRGIRVLFGHVQFTGRNLVELNGQAIEFKKCIVSTGSHPVVLPIEGLKDVNYLTNETIFDLKKLPRSIITLGGGPIGLELAQGLSRLGVKVYVVEMLDRILFREDNEAVAVLEKKLKEEGLEILTGKKAVKFEKRNEEIFAILEDKQGHLRQICAEAVLVAVGRAPNLEGLILEKAGIEYTQAGIKVNDYLQTTNKDVFACGDVVGPYMFSHVAAYQAYIAVRNALFKKITWQKVNYSNIAWAIFTEPEVSRVGLTEEEARQKYQGIKVYKSDYTSSDRAITDLAKEGLIKIITNKKGFILGAHIVGAAAGEIIQGLLIAKALRIPLSKIAPILFIYPTLSELVKKTAAKPLVESLNNPLIKTIIGLMKQKV